MGSQLAIDIFSVIQSFQSCQETFNLPKLFAFQPIMDHPRINLLIVLLTLVGQVRMAVITDGHGNGQLEVESGFVFGEEMPETRWTPVCHTLKGDKCNYSGCGGSWNGKAWCWIEWP